MADLETIPVLRATDLAESQTYFQRLGFACELPAPDYLIVRRAGIELHVCPPDAPDRPNETRYYIRGPGIDALHREWMKTGLVSPRFRRPWGMVEFYASEPGGALLVFGRSARPGDPEDHDLPPHPADPRA